MMMGDGGRVFDGNGDGDGDGDVGMVMVMVMVILMVMEMGKAVMAHTQRPASFPFAIINAENP